MTEFTELLAAFEAEGGGYRVAVGDDWLQGRTLYGGLSAALCLEAALRAHPDLPPLRAAQFAFVGPASGPVTLTPTLLRRGKSAATVSVDLVSETGIGTRAILTFGAARPSELSRAAARAPAVSRPAESQDFYGKGRPAFGYHFEARNVGPSPFFAGGDDPKLLVWFRHLDPGARHTLTGLLALADAPPPAAMALFKAPAPISTMTWSIEVLDAPTPGDDGWRLIRSEAEQIEGGYSSQSMSIWDEAGAPLLVSRQCVAVFA